MSGMDEMLAQLNALPEAERARLREQTARATAKMKWLPLPGPQTDAYFSVADVMLYGGGAGGGKSALLLGLAFTAHQRSLLMRRQYTDLGGLTEEAIRINGSKSGYNGSTPPKLRVRGHRSDRLIEFGAAQQLGDEQSWMGRPHDLLGFDEAVQFLESQIRFLMGWVRSADPAQRCRTILATNPPLDAAGVWIVGMFRPWLDPMHHNPAQPGELRWYVTDPDGKDMEVEGPEPHQFPGLAAPTLPQSRTFIRSMVQDNPYLIKAGYAAQLDSLQEPMRSALRDGNFIIARKDAEFQVIPSEWVRQAQARWKAGRPPGVPMCALGVDVAAGGEDNTVLAARYDGWFDKLIVVPGKQTPLGRDVAGLIVAHRRNDADVGIDFGGGYGGMAYEHLRDNQIRVFAYKGQETQGVGRTRDGKFSFANRRSEMVWKFREALDPGQDGGSPIALDPGDQLLAADLTAPTFQITPRGIKVELAEDVKARIGRSPDRGTAVMIAWMTGPKYRFGQSADPMSEMGVVGRRSGTFVPRVILGHRAVREAAGR